MGDMMNIRSSDVLEHCDHEKRKESVVDDTCLIATRFSSDVSRFFNRFRCKGAFRQFVNAADTETYRCLQFDDRTNRLEQVTNGDQIGRIEKSDFYARVTTAGIPCVLSYSELRDQDGRQFDLVVVGTWKIGNPRAFLREYGQERLKVASGIEVASLESTLANRCQQALTDVVRTVTYEALKNQDALPLRFWETNLVHWIDMDWLELVDVKEVRYESATGDRAAEVERRRELQALEDTEREEQNKRDLAQIREQAEYEEALRNLKMAQELSERDRQKRLEELNWEHDQEVLAREREMEIAMLKHENQKAELLAKIEDLREQKEAAQEIRRRAKEAKSRIEDRLQVIEDAQKEQAEAALFAKEVSQNGMDAIERVSTAVAGISTTTMALLGKTSGPTYLAQVFREKAAASPDAVMMKKVEIRTRDIGNKKVGTLAIGSPLRFEFLANRGGYATVLNIGTSGKVYLQSPNAYVGIRQCQLEAGKRYQVPGVELLPAEQLQRNGGGYFENGPPGWEELIVIISSEPLMADADLFPSTEDHPFVALSADRIEQLLNQLAELPEDGWNVGMLSFLVE